MAQVLKIQKFPGLQRYGENAVETHDTTEALRQAQWRLEARLHDLRSEFLEREQNIRATYLSEVMAITVADS